MAWPSASAAWPSGSRARTSAPADAGVLTVLYGLGGARQEQFTQKQAGGQVEAGDRFGEALGAPFRLNPGLNEGLGVGAPGETVGRAGGRRLQRPGRRGERRRAPHRPDLLPGPPNPPLLTVGGTPEAGDALGAAILSRDGLELRSAQAGEHLRRHQFDVRRHHQRGQP